VEGLTAGSVRVPKSKCRDGIGGGGGGGDCFFFFLTTVSLLGVRVLVILSVEIPLSPS